jgi:type II secretory ATPase GspE/PulE/Tfp pilus assembly ATPase PilB-like protein
MIGFDRITFDSQIIGGRADPDIIMVGEMRDYETAKMRVDASTTGHLVLSTLHTNNAPETIVRLLDMGIDPFSFADSLLCVLAQRLVRSLCVACKDVRRGAASGNASSEAANNHRSQCLAGTRRIRARPGSRG